MLNERIKQLRLAQRLSQVELAERLSVTKQTISNWENNNIQPSIDFLVRLADVFGVSTDYLLGRETIPRISTENLPEDVVQHICILIEDLRRDQ